MVERIYPNPARPSKFEDRFRLYLDESGDHVHRDTVEIAHRYLCLLGCWFRNPEYLVVPGRVLRLFCSFTAPPKEKSSRLGLFPP